MRQAHVNNVQYLRYAETSRIHFFHRLLRHKVPAERRKAWTDLVSPRSKGLILKRATVDFLFVGVPIGFFTYVTADLRSNSL